MRVAYGAGDIVDLRERHGALVVAGITRAGTGRVRGEMMRCDDLVNSMERAWMVEARDVLPREVSGPSNPTTRDYQQQIEAQANALASRGAYRLAGKEWSTAETFSSDDGTHVHLDILRYKHAETAILKKNGPFRIQDEQPALVETRRAKFAHMHAAQERRLQAALCGKTKDPAHPATQRKFDAADVAAQGYAHAHRIRNGAPPPRRAEMHDHSRARFHYMKFV